jgi:hypothetical protein
MLGFCVSHKFIVNKCNFGYMWVSYVGNFDPVKSLPTVWWCECAIDMPTYRLLCLRLLKTAVSIDPQCYTIISVSVYILASGQKLRSTSLEEDKQFFLRVSKKLIYLIYFPSFFLFFFFFVELGLEFRALCLQSSTLLLELQLQSILLWLFWSRGVLW